MSKILSLQDIITRVDEEPRVDFIYPGIKSNSLGFIFGPSKSGKTVFAEGLAMAIASGQTEYFGKNISVENRRVLFVSLEEYYTSRTQRNKLQLETYSSPDNSSWVENNYFVVGPEFPRYLHKKKDWYALFRQIVAVNPGVVIIDSLSRLYPGKIEESSNASLVMEWLRKIQERTKVAMVVIHHTPKMSNLPISLSDLAGSRVLGQEADFLYGVNRSGKGRRYIKEVAFRYAPENIDLVDEFQINNNCVPVFIQQITENKILADEDGRADDTNPERIYQAFLTKKGIIKASDLTTELVDTKIMSRQTFYTGMDKLIEEGVIQKAAKGKYKLIKKRL